MPKAKARKLNQVSSEILDQDRLSHVKNKDFSSATQRAGSDQKANRFRNGHQIPLCVSVGHGDRTPPRYLIAEDRNYASTAAENITEPDRTEVRSFVLLLRLHNHFADTL